MAEPQPKSSHPSQRRYPPELKERAVRLVLEAAAASGERQGVITRVAQQLGVGSESLRLWVKQHEIDSGRRAGTTTAGNGIVDWPHCGRVNWPHPRAPWLTFWRTIPWTWSGE